MRYSGSVSLCLVSALFFGCGGPSGPKKYDVTGMVTFDGQPIKKGYIIFQPTTPQDRAEGAQIVDGRYNLTAQPGDKKVEIRGSRPSGKKGTKDDDLEENYVPENYNDKTELTAKVTTNASDNKNLNFTLKPK
jgi:hypothetical protein